MSFRGTIEQLLQLSSEELQGPRADELEDAVQRGLAAVHAGELWIRHMERELHRATSHEPERAAALERELADSRAAVEQVRAHVARLHERAQELGVGAPG